MSDPLFDTPVHHVDLDTPDDTGTLTPTGEIQAAAQAALTIEGTGSPRSLRRISMLTEGVGFEPTGLVRSFRFEVGSIRPLWQPSVEKTSYAGGVT